jgi:type IV pilus assembly protein PilN
MTEINLLPWRETRREHEKKKVSIYLLAGLIFSLVMVFLIYSYAMSMVDDQTQRNQRLKNEINTLNKQIIEISKLKKLRQALIARMNIVQDLQATRILTVRLFDELITITPNGVYLYRIERATNKVTLLGYSESNTSISRLMRNIQASKWIQDPELTEIKKTEEDKPGVQKTESNPYVQNEFNLSFVLKPKTLFGEKNDKSKLK